MSTCETENEKLNDKLLKNKWKTEQETENEKEKRSKREKDKEKEINKTIKTDKNIYPPISPQGEKGDEFQSLSSQLSSFFTNHKDTVYQKSENCFDSLVNTNPIQQENKEIYMSYYRTYFGVKHSSANAFSALHSVRVMRRNHPIKYI